MTAARSAGVPSGEVTMMLAALLACGSSSEGGRVTNPLPSIVAVDHVPFDATVDERVQAGGYSYLRLDDGRWVVGFDKGSRPGDRVHVVPIGFLDSFRSARTGRTFAPLWFGVLSASP